MARVFTDLPCLAIWKGVSYTGIRSTTDMSQTLDVGGVDERIEYQFFISSAVIPAQALREGEILIIDGQHMKVVRVRNSPDGSQLRTLDMAYARTRGAV